MIWDFVQKWVAQTPKAKVAQSGMVVNKMLNEEENSKAQYFMATN